MTDSNTLHLLDLLDSAYRVDLDDDAWMEAVVENARPLLDRGLGVNGYHVDASSPAAFHTWGFTCAGSDVDAERRRFERWSRHAPLALKRHAHLQVPISFASQLPPGNVARAAFEESFELTAWHDVLGISAVDPDGLGCALAIPVPLRQTRPPRAEMIGLWERASAHLASALRLRRRLRRASTPPSAIVNPASGRVEHADDATKHPSDLEHLREAAVRFDRARVRGAGHAPLEVTDHWRALVSGRWTLVDEFERDGRRYIVARPNRPAPAPLDRLSPRETEVVRAAAFGHSNKLIAYELGIAPSTVSSCLRRAIDKLGVRDQIELIRRCAAHFGAPPPEPPAPGES